MKEGESKKRDDNIWGHLRTEAGMKLETEFLADLEIGD